MHEANGVKPMYRGVSTDGSGTVVVIHQAAPGVAVKLFEDNKDAIANTGHVIDSTQIMTFKNNGAVDFHEINQDNHLGIYFDFIC